MSKEEKAKEEQELASKEDVDEILNEDDKSSELDEAKAEFGILSDYLEREYSGIGKVRIYHPTLDIDSEVENLYIKEFNKLLMNEDFPTQNKMERVLKEKGIWTQEDENQIEKVMERITDLQVEYAQLRRKIQENSGKVTKTVINKMKKLSEQISEKNIELATLSLKKSSLFEGTVENRAQRKALLYKFVKCVKRENGEQVWENLEELGKANGNLVKPMVTDAMKFWRGVDSPLLEGLQDLINGS